MYARAFIQRNLVIIVASCGKIDLCFGFLSSVSIIEESFSGRFFDQKGLFDTFPWFGRLLMLLGDCVGWRREKKTVGISRLVAFPGLDFRNSPFSKSNCDTKMAQAQTFKLFLRFTGKICTFNHLNFIGE